MEKHTLTMPHCICKEAVVERTAVSSTIIKKTRYIDQNFFSEKFFSENLCSVPEPFCLLFGLVHTPLLNTLVVGIKLKNFKLFDILK